MIQAFPKAKVMLGDKGYDADWFREALHNRKIQVCIPSKANRKVPIPHDTVLYKQRHKIENMFGKLKDWRLKWSCKTGQHAKMYPPLRTGYANDDKTG